MGGKLNCYITLIKDFEILDFDYSVFEREDDSAATIQKVFVRFATFDNGNEYDFMCVSQAERDVDEDSDVFWYAPKE